MNAIKTIEVSLVSEHERALVITLSKDLVEKEYKNSLSIVQKKASMPGFRKGKLPNNLVENYFSKEIKQRLLEKLVDESLSDACSKESLTPVSKPQIESLNEISKDIDFSYRAIFEVKPKIKVKKYLGLEITVPKITFDDSSIEDELKLIQGSMATFIEPKERATINLNDRVYIDYDIEIDGKIDEKYRESNKIVELFNNNLHEEFKKAFFGKKIAEIVRVDQMFPKNFHDEKFREKPYTVIATIKSFKERILPLIDDNLAKDFSNDFQTLVELKATINERLSTATKRRNKYYLKDAISKKIMDDNEISVPDSMIKNMAISLIDKYVKNNSKESTDELFAQPKEKIWEHFKTMAFTNVKLGLIFEHLIDELKIEADTKKVEEIIKEDKNISKEDAIYSTQVDALLDFLEKKANIFYKDEPLYGKKTNA